MAALFAPSAKIFTDRDSIGGTNSASFVWVGGDASRKGG
jgi:hypothetical protein